MNVKAGSGNLIQGLAFRALRRRQHVWPLSSLTRGPAVLWRPRGLVWLLCTPTPATWAGLQRPGPFPPLDCRHGAGAGPCRRGRWQVSWGWDESVERRLQGMRASP